LDHEVRRLWGLLLLIGATAGCGDPSTLPANSSGVTTVAANNLVPHRPNIEASLGVSVQAKDGLTCLTVDPPDSDPYGGCQFPVHTALTYVYAGAIKDPAGYQATVWAMDLGSIPFDFKPGPQAPDLIASAADGYVIVAHPGEQALYNRWSMSVRAADGSVQRCEFARGTASCGSP
jgi:hypothetical protein